MGNEVRRLHGQLRAAKKLQQENGQGVAGMPQEHLGWVKRPQEWPQARQEWAWVTRELQEMQAVAQPLEAKVHGAAKPPPRAAKPPSPWAGGLAQLPKVVPAWWAPKPSSWLCVNNPAAFITTSKVAASLHWQASSATYSSPLSRQASSSSISAGGGTLPVRQPWALELMLGPATWSPGPPTQIPAVAS